MNTNRIMKWMTCLLLALTIFAVGAVALVGPAKTGPETIVLTKKNLLVLNKEVGGKIVSSLIVKAKELDQNSYSNTIPIYLYMNTPGGSVMDGLELVEALKGLDRPVHTITAFSASMGFQIVQSLGNRYVLKNGILMSHRAAGTFEGTFGGLSPSQLDQRVRLWVKITQEMDEQTVFRTNGKQTLESYQKAYSNELWITGQESVLEGYADSLIHVKCDKTIVGVSTQSVVFMGMNIDYDLDNCPINSSPMNIRIGNNAGMTDEYMDMVKKIFISNYQMKASTPLPMVF